MNLNGSEPKDTFHRLLQITGSEVYDGTGSRIYDFAVTTSHSHTSTYSQASANLDAYEFTKLNLVAISQSINLVVVDTGSCIGYVFDYAITDGEASRAGTINGTVRGTPQISHFTTPEISGSEAVSMSVTVTGSSIIVRANINSGSWDVSAYCKYL